MHALILQFESDDGPEHLAGCLTRQGCTWDVVRMDLPHPPLSLDGFHLVIGLGGEMHANDIDRFPFLGEAVDVLTGVIARDLPSLGVCLTGQILAKAMGAEVTRNHRLERGLVPVMLDVESHDPLLQGLDPVLQTVQYHQDTFGLPDGGVLLASSADCPNQIVRCTPRAYALQFHPEVSADTFRSWVESAAGEGNLTAVSPAERAAVEAVYANEAIARRHADLLIDNFINLAAQAQTKVPPV